MTKTLAIEEIRHIQKQNCPNPKQNFLVTVRLIVKLDR